MKNYKLLLAVALIGLFTTSCKKELESELLGRWNGFQQETKEGTITDISNVRINFTKHGQLETTVTYNANYGVYDYVAVDDRLNIKFRDGYKGFKYPENSSYKFKWGKKDTLVLTDVVTKEITKFIR